MDFRRLLITGGAGFVGSNLAVLFKQSTPDLSVVVLDSLKRRGSELNLPRLQEAGVEFYHGDIRCPEDLDSVPDFDLLIDCSAEPSVQSGAQGGPLYVLYTNLVGTVNCLEAARKRGAAFLFLSTSRVYPIAALNALPYHESATRFEWDVATDVRGVSSRGISEEFSLEGARSFYGSSKLACELLISEYVYNYGLRAITNRCGILTGPWQMGTVEQGVTTLWVARHYFQRPLTYIGFGGSGKQVRDLLHVEDLFALLVRQMRNPHCWDGRIYNVGGGTEVSVSLQELTALCRAVTGNRIPIEPNPTTNPLDLRIYLTDARKAQQDFDWSPTHKPERIVGDIYRWIANHDSQLRALLT